MAKRSPLMTLTGDKALERKLSKLGGRVAKRVLRKAMNAAATPVVKAARGNVSVRSGLLKKSIGKTVRVKGTRAGARVGARTNVAASDDAGNKVEPWRYAHLVELGHIDENGQHVPAKPFLRPAAEQTKGQAADVLSDKLAEGVLREATR